MKMAHYRKEFKQTFVAIAMHHSLAKMMPVGSHQNKRYVHTTWLAPRVATHTAIFSDAMTQPALSVCPIALETAVPSSFPNSRLFSFADSGFTSATPQSTSATT